MISTVCSLWIPFSDFYVITNYTDSESELTSHNLYRLLQSNVVDFPLFSNAYKIVVRGGSLSGIRRSLDTMSVVS